MTEAFIAGYGTAVPYRCSQERYLEVDAEARRLHGQGEGTLAMIRQLSAGSKVSFRHTLEPCWLEDDERPADVLDIFRPNMFNPPGWQRMANWQRLVPPLAVRAAQAALANWGGSPSDITHVVTTCTSGWAEPGISCELIYSLGLSLDTQKQELNFNGCFCGMTCLRVARDIVRAGEARAVLVVAVESPSTQYNPTITDVSHIVASVLFGDGAAAFVVAREGTWRFDRAGMSLVPDTRTHLRMSPEITGPGETYRMHLNPKVGARLGEYFRNERGRELIDAILERSAGKYPALVVHPGGPAILEGIATAFVERGWGADALDVSSEILWNNGNLGAAAMLFVLAQSLPRVTTDRIETLAFGPGVTVEWGSLSRV